MNKLKKLQWHVKSCLSKQLQDTGISSIFPSESSFCNKNNARTLIISRPLWIIPMVDSFILISDHACFLQSTEHIFVSLLISLTINNLKYSTGLMESCKSTYRPGPPLYGKYGDSMLNVIPVWCFMPLLKITSSSVLTPCLLLNQIFMFMLLSLLQSLSEISLHSLPCNNSPYNTSSYIVFQHPVALLYHLNTFPSILTQLCIQFSHPQATVNLLKLLQCSSK
jgi:hypothetical protein